MRRPARDTSIALIVSATLTAVVTLVLLAFAALFYDIERERGWEQLRQTLATSADQLAVAVALPVWNFDPSQIEVLMFSALSNRNLQACVVSARPSQLDYVVQRDAGGALRGGGPAPAAAGLLRTARPIMVEGQRVGEVAVYATPAPLLAQLRQRRWAIAGIIVVLDAALVASVYLLLWYLMLKPLKAVRQYAASVEAGGPGEMRAGVHFYGELRAVSASVRNMVELLDKRYRELLRHRNHLEELVAERTAALRAAARQAKAANRAKSVFLATMSHELRTPLNAVIGFSRLMGEAASMSPDEKRNLAIIHRAGQQLLRLINDILELSKIEAGRVVLQQVAVDVAELTREVLDMVRARASEAGVALTLRCEGAPPAVRLDGARLRQVLLNLMSNAVKFAEGGEVVLELRCQGTADGGYWLAFAVRDSGIGIARADQARIFEPFYQVDDGAGKEGTGLGLAISREFVQLMGGTLAVASSPGHGSVFSFTIRAEAEQASRLAAPPATPVRGLAPPQRGKRILVVDDNADGRQLLASVLAPFGFVVGQAGSGAEALRALAEAPVDLVLVDWRMPGIDGLEVTRRVRAGAGRQPRVVVLTASAYEDEHQQALAAGADGFLRKPVDDDALYQMLERQLDVTFERGQPDAALAPAPAMPLATAQQIAGLPATVRTALRAALRELNQPKVLDLLAPYRGGHGPLVEAVERMLQQYQYRQLCQLIDEAEGARPDE